MMQIKVWYQNRRTKAKRERTDSDAESGSVTQRDDKKEEW